MNKQDDQADGFKSDHTCPLCGAIRTRPYMPPDEDPLQRRLAEMAKAQGVTHDIAE